MSNFNKRAFFVMPFGKNDTDKIWEKIYKPVMNNFKFEAIRIDEQDNGKIKIDQIYNELSISDLIIGDLTYRRPNCYFEIGYAMAKRLDEEIILCAKKGHKIHFDLAAYDILSWDLSFLENFKSRFESRIRERSKLISKRVAIPESSSSKQIVKNHIPFDDALESYAQQIRKDIKL